MIEGHTTREDLRTPSTITNERLPYRLHWPTRPTHKRHRLKIKRLRDMRTIQSPFLATRVAMNSRGAAPYSFGDNEVLPGTIERAISEPLDLTQEDQAATITPMQRTRDPFFRRGRRAIRLVPHTVGTVLVLTKVRQRAITARLPASLTKSLVAGRQFITAMAIRSIRHPTLRMATGRWFLSLAMDQWNKLFRSRTLGIVTCDKHMRLSYLSLTRFPEDCLCDDIQSALLAVVAERPLLRRPPCTKLLPAWTGPYTRRLHTFFATVDLMLCERERYLTLATLPLHRTNPYTLGMGQSLLDGSKSA